MLDSFGMDKKNLTPDIDFKVVVGMMITLIFVGAIAIATIRQSSPIIYTPQTPNPSPLGYTVSLVMFIVPAAGIKWWFMRNPEYKVEKKAYWITIGILAPLGFFLDALFGNSFFTFENKAATIGIDLLGYKFGQGWVWSIPLEEFIFYFSGFLMILLVYVWGDMYWFGAYNVDDYKANVQDLKKILSFHLPLLIFSLAMIAAAILFKYYFAPAQYREGFPGYFVFLIALAVTPTIFLFKVAKPFVNWRAFSFSLFMLLFLSLLWEGTLGVPYAWWGYRPQQMVGIMMLPMANLPIEAVAVWFVTTWTTIIFYEVIKIFLYMERPLKDAFLGSGAGGTLGDR